MNAGACLCCGAPFSPNRDDLLTDSKVGNLSMLRISRDWSTDPGLVRQCKGTKFYAACEGSHIFHKSHHKDAILFMDGLDDYEREIRFKFKMNPTGKKVKTFTARWDGLDTATPFGGLHEKLNGMDIIHRVDTEMMLPCCKTCNGVMTMEYWFRYLLYGENGNRLIQSGSMDLLNANGGGHPNSVPKDQYSHLEDIMSPAIAYYLHGCVFGLVFKDEFEKSLYIHLCWIILEILCLQCEYAYGSGNKSTNSTQHRYNQPTKSILGAIELYLSYFAWLVLRNKYDNMGNICFEAWHLLYASEAAPVFHPRKLLAEYIRVGNPKETWVGNALISVYMKITEALANLEQVARFIDKAEGIPRKIICHFVPFELVNHIQTRMVRGVMGDLDSYLILFGIDAMFNRVFTLSRDVSGELRKTMMNFWVAMRQAEIRNMERNNKLSLAIPAHMAYRLTKLRFQPNPKSIPKMTVLELRAKCQEVRCSPWAAVKDLYDMGAFGALEMTE